MRTGVIAKKVGMTRLFQADGRHVPVTVLQMESVQVVGRREADRDGYTAVQLGTDEKQRLSKPRAGQLGDLPSLGTLREFRVDDVSEYEVGQTLAVADVFAEGDLVDVSGVSKGKGFAGHVKRHHFGRGPTTHGSDHHREPGSIGPGTTPGRVYKGVRMAGHMGDEQVTTKKVRVVRADAEKNLLLVKGSLPGARGSLILVRKA